MLDRCTRCGARILAVHLPCPQCGTGSIDPHPQGERRQSVQIEVLRGMASFPRAVLSILRRPGTWPILAVPILLNVVFAIGVAYVVVPQLTNWLAWVTSPGALRDWTGWWTPPRLAIVFLGWLVRGVEFFAVPGLTAWVLSTPPFRVFFAAASVVVSDRFERDVLGESPADRFEESRIARSVAAAIISSIGLIAVETALYLLLLPVALLPFFGTFVWLVTPRVVVAGLDQTDPVLVRKLYYPSEKAALWWRHRWRVLGFGAAMLLLLGAPFLNGFALAVAPVAGTLLFLDLDPK